MHMCKERKGDLRSIDCCGWARKRQAVFKALPSVHLQLSVVSLVFGRLSVQSNIIFLSFPL